MAIVQFFKTTCIGIFKYLFAAGSIEDGLLRPVSTYFSMVETNGQGMLHLHYLVWLWGAFHLSELCNQFLSDSLYTTNMMKFIDNIICYLIVDVLDWKKASRKALSASLDKTNGEFTLKLYKNSNFIAFTIHIYSSSHNATCFQYGAAVIRKCWFDFFYLCIMETKVINPCSIEISSNNLWVNS